MIGHNPVFLEKRYENEPIPFQPQLPPSVQKFEPEREIYSYYRTQILQPTNGYPTSINLIPTDTTTMKTRFDIAPCMFNMRTLSLSFQCQPTNPVQFGPDNQNAIIPNYYFPWIKSFKLISQPNSTILFQCDNVDHYSLMNSYINLNQNKRLRQEGLIVPSQRSKCGYEAYVAGGFMNQDPFLAQTQYNLATEQIMPDNMNDASQYYSGPVASYPQNQVINIKLSDLFFDSIFQHEDYLLKYGCYILIEWQQYNNILWAVNDTAGEASIISQQVTQIDAYAITLSNISLQIDQQQNKYIVQNAEIENSREKFISIPYIYEFSGFAENPSLIFQLMNQSDYPQKLYKLYTALLYSLPGPDYLPLTNGNLYRYDSEAQLSAIAGAPLQSGIYDEVKLFFDNVLFDDIHFDNISSLNMLMRKLKRQFHNSAHSGIKSILCNCTIPFKFDDVYDDTELYISKQPKGIEISHKILPIRIEIARTGGNPAYPEGSFIKAIPVVMRTFKFVNGQFYYV